MSHTSSLLFLLNVIWYKNEDLLGSKFFQNFSTVFGFVLLLISSTIFRSIGSLGTNFPIVLRIIKNCVIWSFKTDSNQDIMLAQYFTFLAHYIRIVIALGSILLAKSNKTSLRTIDDMSKGKLIMGTLINMLFPILLWLSIKFQYHCPLEVLLLAVAYLIDPFLYFFGKMGSGYLLCWSRLCEIHYGQVPIFQAPSIAISLDNGSTQSSCCLQLLHL